jgi:F0F1-type ATP synthase epsilon subunit
MLEVVIANPHKILFQGQAKSVIFPGDAGVFEIWPFHKRLMSRLIQGNIHVDGHVFPILRGVVKVDRNSVTVVVEDKPS